jgi:hypothetical protein
METILTCHKEAQKAPKATEPFVLFVAQTNLQRAARSGVN